MEDQVEIIKCQLCKRKLGDSEEGVSVSHAQTTDVGNVCKTCWPHYVSASITCKTVFGNEFGVGKRGGLEL
jgi:hypothetical protein